MGEKQGHTPGPWERDGDFFEVCRVEFEGSGSYTTISSRSRIGGPVAFAVGTPDMHWRDDAEQDANARLIAAAPDLLAALSDILPPTLCGESWDLPDHDAVPITITFGKLRAARAAISRATGEDSPANEGEGGR
ncbi:hypothetical protein [uncultured Brevundimonas sp.]|uniref:hypothetical protein n=1 Tax=uncultured Brevundimonas sp. TaxID=213418 RepID=UPI0025E18D78|nr:hypothetical protein [uncultured Brevundimonas sp.]